MTFTLKLVVSYSLVSAKSLFFTIITVSSAGTFLNKLVALELIKMFSSSNLRFVICSLECLVFLKADCVFPDMANGSHEQFLELTIGSTGSEHPIFLVSGIDVVACVTKSETVSFVGWIGNEFFIFIGSYLFWLPPTLLSP